MLEERLQHLSNLTTVEASALIQKAEGHLCMRLYRRRDGTLLTADWPAGIRTALRRLLGLASFGVLLIAGLQSTVWLVTLGEPGHELPPIPTGPGVTLSDWTDWAAIALGIRTAPPSGPFVVGGDVF